MTRTRFLAAGLLLAAVVPLAACGGGSNPLAPATSPAAGSTGGSTGAAGSVKIGSADFPEAALLGEIYAQVLEAKGTSVTRQFNIGSRETYLKADHRRRGRRAGRVHRLAAELLRQERQGRAARRGLRGAAEAVPQGLRCSTSPRRRTRTPSR